MQSDTIIGIVGAVVLVAVMIGVFAYEYNNVPEDDMTDPDSPEAKMMTFNETYTSLSAMDDLDGDGIPNYQDGDIDGDGTPNDEDDVLTVTETFTGTVPAPAAGNQNPSGTFDFTVGQGMSGGMVTVSWSVTQPAPALPAVGELVVSIGGEEDVACDNSSATEAVCDMTGYGPGDYTVTVRHSSAQTSGGQSNDYSGAIELTYFS